MGEENGDCVAETGCDEGPGRCWSADKSDWRLGPSSPLIKFAILGGLVRVGSPAGNPGCGSVTGGTGGTPNAGLGTNGAGGTPRCIA